MSRLALPPILVAASLQSGGPPPLARFVEAASSDRRVAEAALSAIAARWKDGYAAMLIDIAGLLPGPRPAPLPQAEIPSLRGDADDDDRRRLLDGAPPLGDPGSPSRRRLIGFLERQTGRRFGDDINRWRTWMWALPYDPHPEYASLKAILYGQIDPRMREFFPANVRASIRLDEIEWGGVTVNGIPPLRYPKVIPTRDAAYLKDSHVVFGIVVNGEARAYPKRILGWHEMAIDRLGGVELTIVYCTLCGTVIPFESVAGGRTFRLGTSGLLYRSNKLMFDEESRSLWSTFEGVPVVGPLVGSGVALRPRPAVTTTWKEWKAAHPESTVLSLDTGYRRDYSEGAAYRDYLASDQLMFQVSKTDARLANKAEVVVMRISDGAAQVPVALDTRLLRRRPVYSFTAANQRFLVVTTSGGANRVYRTMVDFPDQRVGPVLVDAANQAWRVGEDALVKQGDSSARAPRVDAQRAFWFGWYAQFPQTLLFR
jgi:hypothetical protein